MGPGSVLKPGARGSSKKIRKKIETGLTNETDKPVAASGKQARSERTAMIPSSSTEVLPPATFTPDL